ncbi:unnamed protein product [Cuscuta europaea]|uniref:Gnk2-homologous domain-containing protein n=1 Tax=Cuscuta europaea TaxID=41803 RepID=A0A9P0ZDI9_CUSEU|nr:unnamed protein product [Cuscuta europaea]
MEALILLLPLFLFQSITQSRAARIDAFIYGGCSPTKFNPGTVYESNVNSALTSLVNSADSVSFNKFKTSLPGSTQPDVIYSLYQCRGDLSVSDCRSCVARAVSQLGSLCVDTSGGALQLDGCFVKYDNISFFGAADTAEVIHKCGPSISSSSDETTSRYTVLTGLSTAGQYFRVFGYGRVQGMAQCTQDVDSSACQNCLSEAIGRLKSECGFASWGYVYLVKCYARYSEHGFSQKSAGESERKLAIIIGIIGGVAVLVVLLSVLSKLCYAKGGR